MNLDLSRSNITGEEKVPECICKSAVTAELVRKSFNCLQRIANYLRWSFRRGNHASTEPGGRVWIFSPKGPKGGNLSPAGKPPSSTPFPGAIRDVKRLTIPCKKKGNGATC